MHSDKVSGTSDGSKERASASSTETRRVKLIVSLRSPLNSSLSMWMSSSRWTRRPLKPLNKQLVRSLLLLRSLLIQWELDWSAVLHTPVSYTHLRAHETRHDLVC